MRTIWTVCVSTFCAFAAASPAQAADAIEGYWVHRGEHVDGLVEITPGGKIGSFKGTVLRVTTFARCQHKPPEEMWRMRYQADGTYRGTHVNYTRTGCKPVPDAHALFRVRSTPQGDRLDFCAAPPEADPPQKVTDDCYVLERAGHARDLSRMCSTSPVRASRASNDPKDVCINGPSELRTLGCLRPRNKGRDRFSVTFRRRSARDDVGVKRRTNRGGLVDGRARIKSVKFKLDRRSRRKDRKAPFRMTVKRSKLSAGSHALLADARLVLRKTRTEPRQVIRRRVLLEFEVCS